MKLNKYILFILFLFKSISLFSQTKEELKIQKIELINEIKYTTELLNSTKFNKTKSLNYLKVLDSQIKSKEQLLITLNIQIVLLNKQIMKTEASILDTKEAIIEEKKELKNLKEEYALIIYASFKQKGKRNDIMFIVSSADFNQAYKRILYLRQYTVFRRNQALKIEAIQKQLISQKEKLAQQKDRLIEESSTKIYLVGSKKSELESINSTKNKKHDLVKMLSKSEKLFKSRLNEKQNMAIVLDNKIRKIIKEEIRKARNLVKGKVGSVNLPNDALYLSSEFKQNKGKLKWPLENGIIVSSYGRQKHPVFPGVETFNNGIDIATDKNADVRVVFDGIVSRIFFIKGEGKAVLVNHGEFFTVYSGLKDVIVKNGEKILSKEKIGVVITHEEEDKTELHFEIWRGYEKFDPSDWLYNAY